VDPPGHLSRAADEGLVPLQRPADLARRPHSGPRRAGPRRAAGALHLRPRTGATDRARLRVEALLRRTGRVRQREHAEQQRRAAAATRATRPRP